MRRARQSILPASFATEEFPNFDVDSEAQRPWRAVWWIPLAELVKIDPKSIGVGQYQHDMNQKKLGEALMAWSRIA